MTPIEALTLLAELKEHVVSCHEPAIRRRDVIASLGQPKVAVMLMLGFSSGLPFFLTGNTLGYWLRDDGHDAGGDRVPVVGRPRLFAEVPVGADHRSRRRAGVRPARPAPRLDDPQPDPRRASAWSASRRDRPAAPAWRRSASSRSIVAFSSSTQDIVVDAWRIEAASDSDELGPALVRLSARLPLRDPRQRRAHPDHRRTISAGAISYAAMAALMAVGDRRQPGRDRAAARASAPPDREPRRRCGARRGFFDAVIGPFTEFFRVYGWLALLMLAMISFYQLPEFVMGPMANPFYHDLGLSKDAVGAVRGSIGLVATLVGIAAGGFSALRFGYLRTLIAGVVLQDAGDRQLCDARAYSGPTSGCSAPSCSPTISASASPVSRW